MRPAESVTLKSNSPWEGFGSPPTFTYISTSTGSSGLVSMVTADELSSMTNLCSLNVDA